MIGDLLESGVPDLMVNNQDAGDDAEDLVEQVDLGDVIGRTPDPGLFYQEGQEADKRVQGMETLSSYLKTGHLETQIFSSFFP